MGFAEGRHFTEGMNLLTHEPGTQRRVVVVVVVLVERRELNYILQYIRISWLAIVIFV